MSSTNPLKSHDSTYKKSIPQKIIARKIRKTYFRFLWNVYDSYLLFPLALILSIQVRSSNFCNTYYQDYLESYWKVFEGSKQHSRAWPVQLHKKYVMYQNWKKKKKEEEISTLVVKYHSYFEIILLWFLLRSL